MDRSAAIIKLGVTEGNGGRPRLRKVSGSGSHLPLKTEALMQRGEIWWADFPPPVHRHPVVVVSRDASTNGRSTVVVAQITARIRETAAEVPLGAEDGLPKTVINVEMLSTISTANLVSRIACLSPAKLARLEQALRHVLDLPALDAAERPRLPVKQTRSNFGGGFSGSMR